MEAGRVFAWAKETNQDAANRFAGLIFSSYWVHCLDIAQDFVLSGCVRDADLSWKDYEAAKAVGVPAALLRRNVEGSIHRGVFGSPFFIVDEERFFGLEKLPVVEDSLISGGW